MAEVIDWGLAESVGIRLASPGPEVEPAEARAIVAELWEVAAAAVAPVAEATGLSAPPESAHTVVVDRPAWIRSNVSGMRSAIGPILERTSAGSGGPITAVGSRITALELGAALAWMSGKVLGQFEAFHPPGERPRLLLVAPTIRSVEQRLGVQPRDFRMWVALHEETHRVQFGAVPWLGDHMLAEVDRLLSLADLRADEVMARLAAGVRAVGGGGSLVDAMQTPRQREVVDRLTAFMSLLEGHADYVMDHTAPDFIPTLSVIRAKFDARRQSPGTFEGFVRRLLGLDAKLRQYTDGRRFIDCVVDEVGMAGLNVVWSSPQALPTMAEIHEPSLWMARTAPLRAGAL